jgi:hypothetical protein
MVSVEAMGIGTASCSGWDIGILRQLINIHAVKTPQINNNGLKLSCRMILRTTKFMIFPLIVYTIIP